VDEPTNYEIAKAYLEMARGNAEMTRSYMEAATMAQAAATIALVEVLQDIKDSIDASVQRI
jgi:hypothetical protein